VIDADGIHAVAKHPEVLKEILCVLTPHRGEFRVLTGREITTDSTEERAEIVKEEAARLGAVILLKGAVDIISDGAEVVINETGSPYLSVGGTGDTLAGIVGAIAARTDDMMKAAAVGSYINGKAGELAAKKLKDSLMPTDVIDEISHVIS
jgi:NAD(P)H-hydrate epimerase